MKFKYYHLKLEKNCLIRLWKGLPTGRNPSDTAPTPLKSSTQYKFAINCQGFIQKKILQSHLPIQSVSNGWNQYH